MRRIGLSIVVLLSAFVFSSVVEVATPPTTARATPGLSGALPEFLINGDFSGVGAGQVGTPPTNYDFETASAAVGTPPTNNDFASGSFSGWTTSGSPTIQSGGPGGYYARLSSGSQVVKSSAFTVASTAQVFSLNVAAQGGGSFSFWLGIWTGPTYSSVTWKYISACPTTCTNWNNYQFDAVPYQGQSIKLEVDGGVGTANVDDVAAMQETLPAWKAVAGDKVALKSGGPTSNYAEVTTTITSSAFTVDSNAQNMKFDTKVSSASGTYVLNVLSGGSYATSTTVFAGSQADSSSWGTKTVGVGLWTGQSIKIQVIPYSATLQLDNVVTTWNELPGWAGGSAKPVNILSESGFPYVGNVDNILSNPFHADASVVWFRIVYRMKWNFNSTPTDLGSTLEVWDNGYNVWQTGGKQSGSPYDPTDVWIEKYFPIYPSVVGTTHHFTIKGWPPVGGLVVNGEGQPDLASVERVDGPGQNRLLSNTDFCNMYHDRCAARTTAQSKDPVELTSGNFTQVKTDLAIPGRGVSLAFTRAYSAQAPASGPLATASVLGAKWSHNWQASLKEISAGTAATIALPGGAYETWTYSSGAWHPPAGSEGTLVKNGGGDWTLTTGGQLVYAFNSSGQWTSVKDRNNNTTSLTYSSGKLTTITDPGSRTLSISYNGDNRISSVSDGTRSVSYTYTNGDLTSITDVMGGTVAYTYSGHLLTQGTDANGNVFVRNTYDSYGRVTQQLDAEDGVTTIAYATPGAGATRVTDQRGKQTTYYFDTSMRITDVVDDDGGTTTTAYDANNNKTSVTNALGKVWSYTYDSHHNVLTATDPLSKVWTYTYNAKNDVLTVTDPLSHATTYAYDGTGNLTSVTDAYSKATTFTVNGNGQVTAVTDPLSHVTSFGYDSYGNRTTVTNALSKVWTYAFDGLGRVTSVTDPLSHATSYTYNAANLALTATDALSHVTTYAYDDNGNVLTVSDANSNVTTYVYNERDQLTSVTDAASGAWSFAYDEVGNLVSKTNPRSKTTTYAYDDLSRLHTETDPLSKVRTYNYDAAGRLTSRVDPKSQQLDYTYNDRNELTRIDYPDPSYVSFAYNDAGARTSMVDGTGTTTYSYDNVYRLTSVAFPGSRTVSYGYDDASRRTSTTYPGGSNQATYAYDNANRLSSVTDWNSHATAYAYDDAGRMTTATLPSGTGIVSTYAYDNANRLTGITHVKGGSTTVASVSYTLDDVGNRTQRVDQAGTHSYSYDDLYRLTSVTYPGPATTSYAFDAFGNRSSMTVGAATTSYSYDDADRLTAVTPPSPASAINYTWDDNGDLTARGSDSFSWDYEDRMVSATVSSVTTTFAYRGDGLRNSKTTGGNTTTFTWDVAAGLPVVLDDGNQYLYGAGLVAQKQSGNWYYYLSDGLGSTMKTVDASGNVVNAYEYDIYGAKTSSSGGQANEFDFAGQETDGSTGLQYLRARYYDPATGTFASREPLASMPKWTDGKFGYAGASPTNNVDPTGLYWGESKVNKAVAFTKKWVAPALGECAAWGASSALAGVALGGTPTGVVIGAAAGCLAGAINSILDTAGVNNSFLTCATWFASGFAQPAKFLLLRGISGAADCAAALLNREYPSKSGASECTEWGAAGLAVGVVTRGAGAAERAVAAFAGCAGGYMGGQVNALASSR